MNQHLERLEQLAPVLRQPAAEFLRRAQAKAGVVLMIVFAWRSVAQQWALYQQGRTFSRELNDWLVSEPDKVVTKAKPGTSAHNLVTRNGEPASLALDVIPLNAQGQAVWNTSDTVWARLYEITADCGLDPYGDRWGAYLAGDKGHFEEPGWRLKVEGLGLMLPDPRELTKFA